MSTKKVDERIIEEAKKDFKYLIDRGYRKEYALNVVCNHYRIPKNERIKIIRTVHSEEEIKIIKSKLISIEDLKKLKSKEIEINIDGYNVLIGVEAFLKGRVILCDDGIYRDFEGVYGKYKMSEYTEKSLNLLLKLFKKHNIKPTFYFDAQVSKSGELSKMTKNFMEENNINGDAICTKHCDKTLKEKEVVATSDTIIIKSPKVRYVVDLIKELKVVK
ncbi:DUF434 domain-containing protein [Methanotorris igneus]|nr:DUF434 domain-containing protein [Methanotorris igneus]